ncbi:unnamed protein product, partial [Prorocentrum cordatum]
RRRLRELAAIAQQVMRPSARLSLGTCATPAAARAEAPPLGGRSLHANFLRSADRSPVAPLHAHRSPVHVRSRPWAKSTFVPSDEYPWPLHIISSNGAALPHFACCFKFGSFHLVREVRAIPLTSETWEL